MISFLTILTSLFLLATQVLAQGRPGVTRGQIFFGCYTSRPTGNTQTPATQVANSASFSGCLVSLPLPFPSFLQDSARIKADTQTNCGALATPALFGYWQASTQQCWCGSLLQLPNVQQTSNAPCPTAQWTYGRVSTTFTTYGTSPCRSFANVGLAASAYTQVAGPVSCQRQCRSSRFAHFWGDVSDSSPTEYSLSD